MSENTVAKKQEFTTSLSRWSNEITNLVTRDFNTCGVEFDEYSKKCAMNAMSSIFQLVKSTDGASMNNIDTSNLRDVVANVASLKLNSSAVPRECYFQLRTKKVGDSFVKVVEMGIEGDGNDAILRNFGEGIERVYPVWLVKEGDDFTFPKFRGVEIEPPSWEQKGLSDKTVRVVYPVKLTDGSFQYLIAERESVKTNLFAHIRNNMMNETFGICANRYKATDEQKKKIDAKKEEVYEALRGCATLEDMLECEIARPFISGAWLDTTESMVVRKMRNNAIKKFKKNFNPMAKQSFLLQDETYQQVQHDIEENANKEELVIDSEAIEVE